MDDPNYALSRKEDLDPFRKGKFGRTQSFAYGDLTSKATGMPQPSKRNTMPAGASQLSAAANATRTRRNGLSTVTEMGNIMHTDDEETNIGDSLCPPNKCGMAKRLPPETADIPLFATTDDPAIRWTRHLLYPHYYTFY